MKDVIVVGAGIIGATVAKAMQQQGRDVLLLDNEDRLSGTRPSGGHLKPSWFGDMPKAEYEPAMQVLENVWGLHEDYFKIWPAGIKAKVYRVDTDEVVAAAGVEKLFRHVKSVSQLDTFPLIKSNDGEWNCRLLLVAAGVWTETLCPQITEFSPTAKQGVSFRFAGELKYHFISPWAPYKQVVAHQQAENEIWVGDGSAILQKNWTSERTKECENRCRDELAKHNSTKLLKTLHGLRPYCKGLGTDPCLFKQIGKRAWVATGSGKSGTISAGWVVNKLIHATS